MGQHTPAVRSDSPDAPFRPSRRTLIAGGIVAASTAASGTVVLTRAGGGAAGGASLVAPPSATTSRISSTTPRRAPFALPADLDPDLLIARTTYGRTAGTERAVQRLGSTAWLQQQLRPSTVEDPDGASIAGRYPSLRWSPATAHAKLPVGDWRVMRDLGCAHVGRAIWSRRQLYEVMVDFWSNHLNVTCPSSDVWDTRHRYDADVIRKHALGRFDQLLAASAFHPSMLVYLNNAESTGAAPNENYARELLELHTVGIDAGYTERDVRRSALLLTGWQVERGRARFVPARHHLGAISAFGFRAGNGSSSAARSAQRRYLRYLARHPRTAHRIARKLAVRFVADDPPSALVDRLAARYRASGTAIVPVLRELFASPEFAASAGQKVRRPFEHVAASARVLGVRPGQGTQGLLDLYYALGGTGHTPLAWAPPDGYPDRATGWQSPAAALALFNGTTALVHGWWPTTLRLPGAKGLLSDPPSTRAATIDAVARKVYGRRPLARERQAAQTLLAGTELPNSFGRGTFQQTETAALVATLFLMSPGHTLR